MVHIYLIPSEDLFIIYSSRHLVMTDAMLPPTSYSKYGIHLSYLNQSLLYRKSLRDHSREARTMKHEQTVPQRISS